MNEGLERVRTLIGASAFREALTALEGGRTTLISSEEDAERAALGLAALNGLGRWKESIAFGVESLEVLLPSSFRRQAAQVCGYLGVAYMRTGLISEAEAHYRAAIHILSWELGDVLESLRQQKRLALMFHGLGLWHQARFEMEKAISVADRYDATHLAGTLRLNLAVTFIKAGNILRADELLDSAMALFVNLGNRKCLLQGSLVRANILRLRCKHREAMRELKDAISTSRDQQYSREECIALEYSGDCHIADRRPREALDTYERAMEIAERIAPDGDLIPELCHRMAEALVSLGNPNEAIVLCERGLRVARTTHDRYEECAMYRAYAMAHRAAGNPAKALRLADEGIELGRTYEIPYELGRLLSWSGEIRLESPIATEQLHGRRQLWEARAVFERMGIRELVEGIEDILGVAHRTEESGLDQQDCALGDPEARAFGIITRNSIMRESIQLLQSVASSQIPVLLTGESGVGKELLAQALHRMSPRHGAPFIPVNCAAIPIHLHDSEFFGHERGAFTGAISSREGLIAASDKGTLFLDEVGDLPLQVQAALLRVLETGEVRAVGRDTVRRVDIHLVAATNANLEDLIARGAFRRDLYYRLNGIRINVPPLREREEHIVELFRYFWEQACASAKKRLRVGEQVEGFLCSYGWPGNVRELRHEVARAVALSPDGSIVGPEAFLTQVKKRDVEALRRERDRNQESLGERQQILTALRAHRGNKAEAARSLGGMKRTTLIYKIERLGIRPEEYLGIE